MFTSTLFRIESQERLGMAMAPDTTRDSPDERGEDTQSLQTLGIDTQKAQPGSISDSDGESSDDDQERSTRRSSVEAMLALMQSVHTSATADPDIPRIRRPGEQRPAKKRKPTHTVRKEEITELTDEVSRLERRVAFLRGEEITATTANSATDDENPSSQPHHPQIPNSLLRDTIHEQQLRLACARSIISEFLTNDQTVPIHHYVHLTRSKLERQRALQLLKPQHLRIARRFVLERSRHLVSTRPHASTERFINATGDAVYLGFSVVPLPGASSVREVFDAASFFTSNLEISYTDGAGRVTIREQEEESDDPATSQHHFLTTVSDSVFVEGKLVMFVHFDSEQNYGIFTNTFIDRDDLHPYRPLERLREDITAVFMIARENDMIVVRRMSHVRIHNSEHIPVDEALLLDLAEGVSHWGNALVAHVKSSFGRK